MTKTTATRPQLTVEELQQLKWLLGGGLTLLSVSTVFYMDVGALTLMALTMLAVGLATLRPEWLVLVPRWAHRLAFSFVAAFFTADLWFMGELLPAIVRLDLLLLLYRGITYRKKRDDLQVIVLGLFLIVLGGVLSVSLTFAAQILAFTAGALAFLLTITLSEAGGEVTSGKEQVTRENLVPAWARHVRWGHLLARVRLVTDWRVVALGAGLFAGLVALSALLFLAIPRFQLENSFFLERFITKKTMTGFSDTIRFGEVTDITQDNSVALTVDVSDRSGIPAEPYWRMLAMDEYRDGTFRLSARMRRMALGQERGGLDVRGTAREARGDPVYWTFYLESGVSRFLPLLGRFGALRFREPQNYRFGRNLSVMELRAEPATMLAYRVEGMENSAAVADETFAERWREHCSHRGSAAALWLQIGVDEADRATLEGMVKEIQAGASAGEAAPQFSDMGGTPMPRSTGVPPVDLQKPGMRPSLETATVEPIGVVHAGDFLRRAEVWLGQRHGYSLSPRIPAGPGDLLVRWMASSEAGHCELFAGALVLLARSAGLPARVVTGFRGGSWNGYSNNFTLRNSDAHAWCEVFDARAGAWMRSDPTPGAASAARDDSQGEASLAWRLDRSWTARLDSLRVFWYRRIVNFDQRSQLETLRAVKDATERTGLRLREALERWAGEVRGWLTAPWDGRRAVVVGGGIAAVVVLVWLVRRARWGLLLGVFGTVLGFRFAARKRGDAVRAEAGRWLKKFAERGLTDDESAGVVAELQRLRFGARETWGDVPKVFRRARRAWSGGKRRRTESPPYR